MYSPCLIFSWLSCNTFHFFRLPRADGGVSDSIVSERDRVNFRLSSIEFEARLFRVVLLCYCHLETHLWKLLCLLVFCRFIQLSILVLKWKNDLDCQDKEKRREASSWPVSLLPPHGIAREDFQTSTDFL